MADLTNVHLHGSLKGTASERLCGTARMKALEAS